MDYDLNNRFTHHDVDGIKQANITEVQGACLTLAEWLVKILPEGREKSLALTKIEEVMFWADAAIARSK